MTPKDEAEWELLQLATPWWRRLLCFVGFHEKIEPRLYEERCKWCVYYRDDGWP